MNSQQYEHYRTTIPTIATLDELRRVFEEAWKLAKGNTPSRVGMKRLYDQRKAQIEETDSVINK